MSAIDDIIAINGSPQVGSELPSLTNPAADDAKKKAAEDAQKKADDAVAAKKKADEDKNDANIKSGVGTMQSQINSAIGKNQDIFNTIFSHTPQLNPANSFTHAPYLGASSGGGMLMTPNIPAPIQVNTPATVQVMQPLQQPNMVSDRRAKTKIQSGERNVQDFLNAISKGNK